MIPAPAALLAALVATGQTPTPAEVHDLIILGETRPVLVRVSVQVGDRAPAVAWLDAVRAYHATVDRDHDGRVTPAEATAAGVGGPPTPTAPNVNANSTPTRARPEVDRDKDGSISISELGEALTTLAPIFQVRVAGAAERRTDALFDQVDRDKDGKLGRSELATVGGSLRRLDRDDDERISVAEVAAALPDTATTTPAIMMGMSRSPRDLPAPPVLEQSAGESPLRLVRALFRKYDVGGGRTGNRPDGKLSPEEILLPPAAFEQADSNHDGTLNNDEVRRYLADSPRDVAVSVTFASDGSSNPGTIRAEATGGAIVQTLGSRVVEVEVGAIRLDFQLDDAVNRLAQARKFARARFDAADGNGDGYLEASELNPSDDGTPNPLAGMMALLDRNGDGKVYPQEVDDQAAADAGLSLARLTLATDDEGRALFGLLDLNRDRQLGAREVLDAFRRVSACDRDHDNQVAPEEVPHHLRINLTRGDLPAWLAPIGRPDPTEFDSTSTPSAAAPTAGPDWFRKMDRNRDGDVSRREFLGTHSQFDKVDLDHDGLIGPAEADAITPKAKP